MKISAIIRTDLHFARLALLWLILCIAWACEASEAYRWQDRHGTTVYGDTPPAGIVSTPIPLETAPLVAQVEHVIDGDTVILRGGERVRLLGINAPEVPHHNRPGEPLGEEAREALQHLVAGKRVTLLPEKERRDHYGRLLAHLYLEDGRHINALLLERGWVHVSPHWPNTRFAREFMQLERQAREAGRGIWTLERFRLQSVTRAKALRNTFARLEGRVTRVETHRNEIRLHFGTALIATIARDRLETFTAAGISPIKLKGHTLIVRGWVGRSRGLPRITLEHPTQLENLTTITGK